MSSSLDPVATWNCHAESVVNDDTGEPVNAGTPAHTDDDRFWDGKQMDHLRQAFLRKGEARLLREATAIVKNRMDCCPGQTRCGSTRLLDAAVRARLNRAGFVRFTEPEGHIRVWESEDGSVLALLAGEVARPELP